MLFASSHRTSSGPSLAEHVFAKGIGHSPDIAGRSGLTGQSPSWASRGIKGKLRPPAGVLSHRPEFHGARLSTAAAARI